MKNLSFLSLLLFVLITLNSCGDDTPQPFSQVYFSCKIDGAPFNPEYKTDFGYRSIDARLEREDSLLSISGDKGEKSIALFLLDPNKIAIHTPYIFNYNGSNRSVATYDSDFSVGWYITDSVNSGQAIITKLDTTNKIVEGTFYFDAYDSTKNGTVHITDGKFRAYLR